MLQRAVECLRLVHGAEMAAALPEYPEALANTLRVAEMCNVEFDFSLANSDTRRSEFKNVSRSRVTRSFASAGITCL